MNYNPYGYNRYDNYHSSYWNWYSPWGLNYHRYGYGYGYGYGSRYGNGYMWNNWWHPYYNGPDYNDPYYSRNRYSGVAYMNGQRSSLYSTDKGILENSSNSNSTTNYNVGRNENKIEKSVNGEKSEKLDQIKNRNINRVYYALKNSQGVVGPARGYQNRGELENYGNSNSDKKRSSKPNFQTTKYGSTRSYDVSRSSKGSLNNGRGYSRSDLNNSNSTSNVRNYSRTELNSNNSGNKSRSYSRPKSSSSSSNNSRSSYTPPSSSSNSSRSSVGSVSRSSSSSSGSVSRSKR